MSTLQIVSVVRMAGQDYIVISDGMEHTRDPSIVSEAKKRYEMLPSQKNKDRLLKIQKTIDKRIQEFHKSCKNFLKTEYKEHLSVDDESTIDYQGEHVGSCWVQVKPITDGILRDIAEHKGLQLEVY